MRHVTDHNRPQLAAAISARIKAGQGPGAIADDLGYDKGVVYRVADAYGLPIRRGRVPSIHTIRRAVEDMRPADALNYVLEAYEQLSGDTEARHRAFVGMGLTGQEAQVYAALDAHKGRTITREALLSIMANAGNENATGKLLDVVICHIRKKIADWPVEIRTAHTIGYGLHDKTTDTERG